MSITTEQLYRRYWGGLLEHMKTTEFIDRLNAAGLPSAFPIPTQPSGEDWQVFKEWKKGSITMKLDARIKQEDELVLSEHIDITFWGNKAERNAKFEQVKRKCGKIMESAKREDDNWKSYLGEKEREESFVKLVRLNRDRSAQLDRRTQYNWLSEKLLVFWKELSPAINNLE